jgi:hypothetical protein
MTSCAAIVLPESNVNVGTLDAVVKASVTVELRIRSQTSPPLNGWPVVRLRISVKVEPLVEDCILNVLAVSVLILQ